MPLVIDEVRDLARKALALESPAHTLQPTALVNEAYLRPIDRRTTSPDVRGAAKWSIHRSL